MHKMQQKFSQRYKKNANLNFLIQFIHIDNPHLYSNNLIQVQYFVSILMKTRFFLLRKSIQTQTIVKE